MRIERLDVAAFGRLVDWDTGTEPLQDLVVVAGPNEAGKSTIFHFLTTILYGFHPASREGNPHAPWAGHDPGGTVRLCLDDGTAVDVERRLRSQPSAKVTVAGRTEEIRNRPLPWAEHLPRTVYRQVFALTLDELGALDAETWGRIQDRIVGAMGASDLVPARHLVADLEREAGEMWRPNRRGNQRIRTLQEEIRALRDRRRDARARDRRLREVVQAAEEARARLEEVREERHVERMAVERASALAPIRAQLKRIEALRADAGPPEQLSPFPDDPGRELARLRSSLREVEGRCGELQQERTEPEAAVTAFGEADEAVLRRSEDITVFLGRAAVQASLRARLASLSREMGDLRRRLEASAGQILSVPWNEAPWDQVRGTSVSDLRATVRRLRDTEKDLRILEAAQGGVEPRMAPPVPVGVGWAALAVGTILLLWGVGGGGFIAGVLGGALLTSAVTVLLLHRAVSGREAEQVRQRREAVASKESARRSLATALGDLPVSEVTLTGDVNSIPDVVERIQELMRDLEEREAEAESVRGRLTAADADGAALAHASGLGELPDAEAAAHSLDRALRSAERRKEAATAARRELRRIDRDQQRALAALTEARARAEELSRLLETEGDGDPEEGARRIRARVQARDRALQLQDELERAHPDLEEMRERILRAEAAGESWTRDDEDLARRRARVEQLAEEMEGLAATAEALERDAAHARSEETVDAVDSELLALQEREIRLLRERDRRWVLSRLVREADRRFREEHQPDLIRRAGDYLAELTGGRYDRLLADESGDSNELRVRGPAAPTGVALSPPLSTGTLEQAYLALRLAIVDHLDQGTERLPLFVDEVLAHWDRERRDAGLDLLARISRHRQLFVFTCHEDVARALSDRGATTATLPPVG